VSGRIGLAVHACQAGQWVAFLTADEGSPAGRCPPRRRLRAQVIRLGRYPLLVIGEVGDI